ncbi:hypothetical protein BGV60_02865 [Burkholderia ubonensis]|nr:hypothetical protein BGV60_02865 [Burkholderia ubonensis]
MSAAGLHAVLAVDAPVDCVIADGAYSRIAQTEAWSSSGVPPAIPPPASAVVHAQPVTRWHDQIVGYIEEKGLHARHNTYGYDKRAPVEAQISRIKRCIRSTTSMGMASAHGSRRRSRGSSVASDRDC